MAGTGETLVQAFAICAAIHVGFIAFGFEEAIYDFFGGDHPSHDLH